MSQYVYAHTHTHTHTHTRTHTHTHTHMHTYNDMVSAQVLVSECVASDVVEFRSLSTLVVDLATTRSRSSKNAILGLGHGLTVGSTTVFFSLGSLSVSPLCRKCCGGGSGVGSLAQLSSALSEASGPPHGAAHTPCGPSISFTP